MNMENKGSNPDEEKFTQKEIDNSGKELLKLFGKYFGKWAAGFAIIAASMGMAGNYEQEKTEKLESGTSTSMPDTIKKPIPNETFCMGGICVAGQDLPKFLSNMSDSLEKSGSAEEKTVAKETLKKLKKEGLLDNNEAAQNAYNQVEKLI